MVDDALDAVLGDDDGVREVVDQPGDRGEHVGRGGRVEGGGRLVEDDDAGVLGEHGTDGDPLLLPPGEVAQRCVAQLGDVHDVEDLLDAAAHRVRLQAELLHAVGELGLDCLRDEAGERVLPDDADDVGEVAGLVCGGVAAGDTDPALQSPAGEVRHEPVDRPQQGGLAGPGAAHDERELALLDRQVDVGEGGGVGALVGDGHVLEVDGRFGQQAHG